MASDVMITTRTSRAVVAQKTNSTASSYTAPLATTTRPAASSTRAVFDRGAQGLANSSTIAIWPFGTASDDQTASVLVLGWTRTVGGLFVPGFICEVLATFSSTLVGITNTPLQGGSEVLATMLFADVLSLTNGIAVLRQGTSNQDTASFVCDVGGYELFELIWKIGTSTDVNALLIYQ